MTKKSKSTATKATADRAIRVMRVEISTDKETRDRYKHLGTIVQYLTNELWQTWICHSRETGLRKRVLESISRNQEYKATEPPAPEKSASREIKEHYKRQLSEWKKNRPPRIFAIEKGSVLTTTSHLQSFYSISTAQEFGELSKRTAGLIVNAWQSLIGQRKSSNSSLPGWMSILLGREGIPSFRNPLPVPFDKANSSIQFNTETKQFFIVTRTERDPQNGKSTVDRLELFLNKRKARQARVVVTRLLDGSYIWRGSNLEWKDGKLYALLCYEMPICERPSLDPSKVLYVRAGRKTPWRVKIAGQGKSWIFGGNGKHVTFARQKIEYERQTRSEHYRWSGANQKGHGGKRARAVWTKLSSRWLDFSKRYNHEVTNQLVKLAVSRGCGTIVLFSNKSTKNRFLGDWQYFQFASLLSQKCHKGGIQFEKDKSSKNTASANRVPSVRKPNRPKPESSS